MPMLLLSKSQVKSSVYSENTDPRYREIKISANKLGSPPTKSSTPGAYS